MVKKRITLELDEDIVNKVKTRCEELSMSMDCFVNNALVLVIEGRTPADFGLDE